MSAPVVVPVPKLWPGATIVCAATGPSLTAAQLDRCRLDARVIAVNNAYQLAPWADVLYACDQKWWHWHKGVPTFRGLKYSLNASYPDVKVLKNVGQTGLSSNPSGLMTGHNSGYQAINLAVHLGAARILLLGYDMQGGHFFGKHPDKSAPPFAACLKAFPTLVKPLAALGIEIVNCTPGSALTCFPMRSLDEALEMAA